MIEGSRVVTRPNARLFRLAIAALLVLAVAAPLRAAPARAALPPGTYYFHGTAADQANKATPPGTATFDQTAPTGTVPDTQTASPIANQAVPENPLAAYWKGSFIGTLSGDLQLDWWWSSPNPTSVAFGLGMDVTVFADVNDTTQAGTVAGNAYVNLQVHATPTENKSLIPLNGTVATSNLVIQATPHFIDTGEAPVVYYDATSTPSNFSFVAPPAPPAVTFDTTTKVAFAPATIVSPSFLGGEPETTMERQISGSQPGRVDNQRVFVDWPLSSRTQTGQLSRSLNGGDSFRMLLDLTVCPQRDRPNCATGGGGDTKSEVNLYDGTLYFADQEVLVNEAGASSTDHGDTWPVTRQWPVTNIATGVDRQWLAYIDPSVANLGGTDPIEAFLTYHVPGAGQYIQGIDQAGKPIPQPSPQIPLVNQSGTARVDNSSGPAHGWIYQPYRGGAGVMVGTAFAGGNPVPGYINPTNWHPANVVNGDTAVIFPWLQIDGHGNAYMVWVNSADGRVYLSVSPIDDARNNPKAPGGWPGTYWTPKADITPAGVQSTVFPEVTAGDTGRIAVAFMGSTDCNPTPPASNKSDNCSDAAHWNTYVDFLPDALAIVRGAPVSVATGIVSHRVDHRGSVCTSGTTCTGDRSLLDMIDLGFDSDGRVGVVFTDNNNQLAAGPTHTSSSKNGPFTHYAKETQGPSLLASKPAINVTIPLNSRAAAAGDATWPNTAAGRNLPSLDILGTSIGLSADGSQLVAKVRLADTSLAGMQRDLNAYNAATTEPGARLQYTVRFAAGDDIYHLDMDFTSGAVRFFGGLLDADDAVYNAPIPSNPPAAVVGARYVADSGFTVTGSLRNGVLTLMAPKSQFHVDTGTPLYSVASFAMAGPAESDPTATWIANSMRTVDAGFPFDAQLATVQAPPGPVKCDDSSIRDHGNWHDVAETGASGGRICRDVGHHDNGSGTSGSDMELDFYGSGADVMTSRGPRGGNFTMSIDGGTPVNVDEYRAPTDPTHPDSTGRIDLDIDIPVHINAPATGYHTLKIHVVNNSSDPLRNMVYVDGFAFYDGDGVGPPTTANDVSNLVTGTLATLLDAAYPVLVTANTVDLNFVLEAVPGTTLTVKDPTGAVVASGTVRDGVLAVEFGPHSIGAYTVDVRNTTAGQIAFNLWEAVGGA